MERIVQQLFKGKGYGGDENIQQIIVDYCYIYLIEFFQIDEGYLDGK